MSLTRISASTVPLKICRRHAAMLFRLGSVNHPLQENQNMKNHFPILQIVPCRHLSAETYNEYFSLESWPIKAAQVFLENVHDITGLQWWSSLLLCTLLLRSTVTLPIAVYTNYLNVKLESHAPEITKIIKKLKFRMAWVENEHGIETAKKTFKRELKNERAEFYIKHNCHPGKTRVLPFIQIPLWLSVSFALRSMSGAAPAIGSEAAIIHCPGLITGGTLWFSDLTTPDTTWALPIIFGLMNLLNIEMNRLQRPQSAKLFSFSRMLTYSLRGISILMVPLAASVPSCMAYYWTCSVAFSIVQNLLLMQPKVNRFLGVPKSERESDTPLRDIINRAMGRLKDDKK